MSKIERVNGYGDLQAIGQTAKSAQAGGAATAGPTAVGQNHPSNDQVEISQQALMMSKLAQLPEIRTEKVQEIRQQLAQGTYDINGKLSVALDRFMGEYIG